MGRANFWGMAPYAGLAGHPSRFYTTTVGINIGVPHDTLSYTATGRGDESTRESTARPRPLFFALAHMVVRCGPRLMRHGATN